ncbi:MAG: ABC transporter ATP-binding protein [Bacillota bacterium]
MGLHIHASGADAERAAVDTRVLSRLLRYMLPYKWHLAASVLLTLLVSAAGLAGPYLIKVAIDQHIANGDLAGLNLVALLYVATHLVTWVASFGQTYLMSYAGQSAIYTIREELFGHLQKLTFKFYDGIPAGVVMSRVTNDVEALNELISNGITHVFADIVTLGGIILIMVSMDWKLALATFVTLPFLVWCAVVFRERVIQAYREVRNKIANVNANLQESISGVRVTQSFARESKNSERFDQTNLENLQANMQAVSLYSVFAPVVEVIGAVGTCIVLWYGGKLILSQRIEIGVLVAFISYTARFFQPIQDLTNIYNQMQAATAASEKIFGIMDREPEVRSSPDAIELPPIRGEVEFDQVVFGYNPAQPVLHGISLTVSPGQRIALVGPTGAGKSSIINLLSRFYDPQSGAIRIDGHDLREGTLASLRRQMGIVLQDTFLFSGTIRENIRYGKLGATDAEIEAAAKAVNAHEFIARLPQGYDTQVNERGAKLSIGQRQLISFARALLRDPRILILDEATSSVDAYTEVLIQRALEHLLAGRTAFIIAHRLSTIRNADRILVIDDGRIVESGRHEELLATGGLYKTLYEMQFKYQEQ